MKLLKMALAFLCLSATAAAAVPVLWDIDYQDDLGIPGVDVSITGSFIYDADTDTYSDISIETNASPLGASDTTEEVFLQAPTNVIFGDSSGDLTGSLLVFLAPAPEFFTNAGGDVLITNSQIFLCQDPTCGSSTSVSPAGNAFSISGTPIGAIPLPPTGALMLGAFGLLGWRRIRRSSAALA